MDIIRKGHLRPVMAILFLVNFFGLLLCGQGVIHSGWTIQASEAESSMNGIAERYVKLVLAVGQHDSLYVDAYFGPEEWRAAVAIEKKPLAAIEREAKMLIANLQKTDVSEQEQIVQLRRTFLIRQLQSLAARVHMLRGGRYTFEEETKALFNVVVPPFDHKSLQEILSRIDSLLPSGGGTLADRLDRFKKGFIIPKDRVANVFKAAIDEARRRTRQHIALPEDESFTLELVNDKSWIAYNCYKGNNQSVIQLNTDLPYFIDQAVDLACHEGYPGHHVQNVLFEQHLVKERGWVEFTVVPLFSHLSPIMEGSAVFGAEVAFPGRERLAFECDILYPLAGLDPAKAASYDAVMAHVRELGMAESEAGKMYINGRATAEEAAVFLHDYALMSLERARKRISFMDQYRSYVVNLAVGYGLVKNYIEKKGGMADQPGKRWQEYCGLISVPRVPSELR